MRASLCTGSAHIVTVTLPILPFLLLTSPYAALCFTLIGVVWTIFFTFSIPVVKDLPFTRRSGEMVAISPGTAAISFVTGMLIRIFHPIEV